MKKLFVQFLFALATCSANATVTDVTEDQMGKIIADAKVPVVLEIYATWCGPCLVMGGTMAKVDEHYKGKIIFLKLDIDKNPKLSQVIKVIPQTLVFKDRQVIGDMTGSTDDENQVIQVLDKALFPKK